MSQNENVWRYTLKMHEKGTALIEEYKAYDTLVAEAQGFNNPDVDYIVYMETTSANAVDFGQVFLLKMSKVMIEEFMSRPSRLEELSQNLVKNLKANTFSFSNMVPPWDIVYEAFRQEIAYRSVAYGLDPEKQKALDGVDKQTQEDLALIQSLRDLKFAREQYDPTLGSEDYLLESLSNGIAWLVVKTDYVANKVNGIKKYVERLNYFPFLDLDFVLSFFEKLSQFISKLRAMFIKFKKFTKESFPVICGLINGLIEFVAGILEMITLLISRPLNLADVDLFEHIELEYDTLVELLEEILEAFMQDPDKMLNKIEEGVERYWKDRYENKEVNVYQRNYYAGEDIIFAIDIIITVVTVVKGLSKISQKLPKFTQYIDELLGRGGKSARVIEEAIQDSKRVKEWIYGIEYEILSPNLLKMYIDDMVNMCKSKGVRLEIRWIDETHPEAATKLLGRTEITMDKKVLIMHLRPKCPKITLFHERWHLEDFIELGWKRYAEISKKTPWLHEEAVWRRVLHNSNKWSEAELVDAYMYYKKYCYERGASYIENVELESLISKYNY